MNRRPSPTSLRLAPAEKLAIAAAARRRGLTPTAYIKRVALDAASAAPDDTKLVQLYALVAKVLEVVEDELDYRAAATAWEQHVKSGAKLLTGEEVWRELGIQD